jgi:hypothetical protein
MKAQTPEVSSQRILMRVSQFFDPYRKFAAGHVGENPLRELAEKCWNSRNMGTMDFAPTNSSTL